VSPLAVPAVGALAGGAQPVGDLGLAGALLVHAGGAQTNPFHPLKVAATTGGWVSCRGCVHAPLLPQSVAYEGIMAGRYVALFGKNP
jgi:hypothetical protein